MSTLAFQQISDASNVARDVLNVANTFALINCSVLSPVMQSPLLIGCDLRTASYDILSILGNEEVVAVNQGE